MNAIAKLKSIFPQIIIHTQEDEISGENPMIEHECTHHAGRKSEKLKKIVSRSFSCGQCAKILNKGHQFNTKGLPLSTNKIQQIQKIFQNKFDYTKFLATNTITASTIICPTHGEQQMSLQEHVLNYGKDGCPCCFDKNKPTFTNSGIGEISSMQTKKTPKQPKTPKNWIERAKAIFANNVN